MLEHTKTGFLKAIPPGNEEVDEAMLDFPDGYVAKYIEVNGKIKYNTIPDMVKLYNSK